MSNLGHASGRSSLQTLLLTILILYLIMSMPKHANIHHQITFQCQAVPNHNNYLAKTTRYLLPDEFISTLVSTIDFVCIKEMSHISF